jgi:hypothetical protein
VARGEAAFARIWDNPEGQAKLTVERSWVRAVPTDVVSLPA